MCQMCSHKAYTYNDITLVPRKISHIDSRRSEEINLESQISPNIKLKTPILSIYMDDVTESKMAIKMAQMGGLGIIHRLMSIEEQAHEVGLVKRAESLVIPRPYTIDANASLERIEDEFKRLGVGALLIIDGKEKLLGLVSEHDVQLQKQKGHNNLLAYAIMTPLEKLITGDSNITKEQAIDLMLKNRVKKIPLVDKDNKLKGLISKKSILRLNNDLAVRDSMGHLLCAASIGLSSDMMERAGELVDAGTNLIVLAIANAYLEKCLKAVRDIKNNFPNIDLMAGNVTEYHGAKSLFEAGADTALVGIGQGTVCETRIQTGIGVPSFTAIRDAQRAAREDGKFIIQDGGIRKPHQFVKALFGGASAVTVGSLLAGTDESPGEVIDVNGRRVKFYRGLASDDAKQKAAKVNNKFLDNDLDNLYNDIYMHVAAEGVETGFVPYVGGANEVIKKLIGGRRSSQTYLGCENIKELQDVCDENPFGPHGCLCAKNHYAIITSDGTREASPHGLESFTT